MKKRTIKVVHERELDTLLESLGLSNLLDQGKLRCGVCNSKINRENFLCLYPSDDQILICCTKTECYKRILDKGDRTD